MTRLHTVGAPRRPIYRIAKRIYDPFEPKPWSLADERGVLGDRFDDPRGCELPEGQRFRTIYCASTKTGALGETVARVRPHLGEISGLGDVVDTSDDPEPINIHLRGLRDPNHPLRGVLLANWRHARQVYNTMLDSSLCFVDIASPTTVHFLRHELAPVASKFDLTDIDFSTVTGPMREFTRECARFIYEQSAITGEPRFAGIRYVSRLNLNWECWAIFYDRMIHRPGQPEMIVPDDPALVEVARLYGLSIETVAGSGHFLRP